MITFLTAGAPERKKLDKVRSEIEALVCRIEAVADAPLPAGEAAERCLAELATRRTVGRTRLAYFAYEGAVRVDDVLADVLAALLGDELEARVRALFAAGACEDAVPAGERRKLIADLKAEQRKLEIAEEREISALEARGFVVERRIKVDPELILEAWK